MLGESQNNWVIAMQVNSSSNMISPLDTIHSCYDSVDSQAESQLESAVKFCF